MFDRRLESIQSNNPTPWSTRILYQIEYAHELSRFAGGKYDELIEKALQFLVEAEVKEGALTRQTALQAEDMILSLSGEAKKYSVICAAHAHIDMNWMWRWDETVAITLDTFRTMLDLMNEYPDFKFSQSQASVYKIVEDHAPEMLDEIRARVKEGRWEVTATTWVEADKNMPNGESHARHLLYTRRYLSQLLDLADDNFMLDFEPDTFGHQANVPEILASGGVKYYYHCRGDEHHLLYRWQSPSGRSITVYREPTWYLGYIDPAMVLAAPSFCEKHNLDSMLKVYGVGDHGGGPTRKDLERILDMAKWPVFPGIHFGTFAEFYQKVDSIAVELPVITGEQNFVFTGCYTSQSRVKQGNRISEDALYVAEAFNSFASFLGKSYPTEMFATGWQNTLFNQFHDIITGSGVRDTREYARALFQQTLGLANSSKRLAYQTLTRQQEVQPLAVPDTIAEGAGVGFGVEEFKLAQVSRGGGKQRVFHVFNPSPWQRKQPVELVLWDWEGNLDRMAFLGEDGSALGFQLVDTAWKDYWGHRYLRTLVEVTVPPLGYTTIQLIETNQVLDFNLVSPGPRTEHPERLVLENEHLRAGFDRQSCALISLVDKATDKELVSAQRPAHFRYILEDDRAGMTAWIVGRYMQVQDLGEGVRLLKLENDKPLRQSLTYEVRFYGSKLTVTVSLDAGSQRLDYDAVCDWHEIGRPGEGIPQLNFHLPMNYACNGYRYDIPFGTVDRPPLDQDVPANSWGLALAKDLAQPQLQLITSSTYGFRGVHDSLSLDLIRSSYDPDPYPELGIHQVHFAIQVTDREASNKSLISNAVDYNHPMDVTSGKGKEVTSVSFLSLEAGTVAISAVKAPEGGDHEVILRLYETDGQKTAVRLRFVYPVINSDWVDTHEEIVDSKVPLQANGKELSFSMEPYQLAAIRVKLSA